MGEASFDLATLPGNIENFMDLAQAPMATARGTLVASHDKYGRNRP